MDHADCLIVGSGPAGLTAAIYLARFHLAVALVDAGGSRAATIPCTRNHAGHPGGIPGRELLARMAAQAAEHGVAVRHGTLDRLERDGDGFVATLGAERIAARSVLLATGVVNNRPAMDDTIHDDALARGLIRYCPICDGYEVTDARVAVIGRGDHGVEEAIFVRMYSRDVTLISPDTDQALNEGDRARLADAGIAAVAGPCGSLEVDGDAILVPTPGGTLRFDTLYPALGSVIRSELARPLGADMSDEGCLLVDEHQRTTIPGLYAAGDVVAGLDQISHAMGEGGVAATAIRNDLARRSPLRR